MATSKYFLLNGELQLEDTKQFHLRNRAITMGDCIKETIHTCGDRLCFFDEHLRHLREGMAKAQMQIPAKFDNSDDEFYTEISKLLSKNRTFRSANVTIMAYRTATTNIAMPDPVEYLVTEDSVDYLGYDINRDGLRIDIYDDDAKPVTKYSAYQTQADTLMTATVRKQCIMKRLNDMFLLTPDGHLSESAMGGNIFIIQDGTLMTPPASDGCHTDVFRTKVIEAASKAGLGTCTDRHLTLDDLLKCSEIFLGSTSFGIRWISAFRSRRFIKSKAQTIHNRINEMYQAERTENPDAQQDN